MAILIYIFAGEIPFGGNYYIFGLVKAYKTQKREI